MTICRKKKVVDSDRCTFCKTEKETMSHLLWDCTYTETFWKHVLEWITKHTRHVRSLNITEQLVIFGVKDDVTTGWVRKQSEGLGGVVWVYKIGLK